MKDMKAEGHEQKSPGVAKRQRAEEPGQKSKSQSTENESKTGAKDIKRNGPSGRPLVKC